MEKSEPREVLNKCTGRMTEYRHVTKKMTVGEFYEVFQWVECIVAQLPEDRHASVDVARNGMMVVHLDGWSHNVDMDDWIVHCPEDSLFAVMPGKTFDMIFDASDLHPWNYQRLHSDDSAWGRQHLTVPDSNVNYSLIEMPQGSVVSAIETPTNGGPSVDTQLYALGVTHTVSDVPAASDDEITSEMSWHPASGNHGEMLDNLHAAAGPVPDVRVAAEDGDEPEPELPPTITGWTRHGHRIEGMPQRESNRPTQVARCGGAGLCTECSLDESYQRSQYRHWRGLQEQKQVNK